MHEIIISVRAWCKSTRHTHKIEEPLAKVSFFQPAEVKISGLWQRWGNWKKQTTTQSYFIKQETVKAKIRWALKMIMSNYSYRSCAAKC